ncbi:MAG: hypothetical protein P1U56_14925 [Saprospiraceae bacterium]|nr:hypothetical protein [Saprospiraceae bacterium]
MRLTVLLTLIILGLSSGMVAAHGDLDERIKAVSLDIEANPDSASLYFTRGKLRFQHEEYQKCIDDLSTSIQKGYIHDLHNLYLAKSYFQLENYRLATENLDEFDSQNPINVVSIKLRGRVLFAQKEYEASALCFEKVISKTIKSLPENYLEATESWLASSHSEKYQKTVAVLELGLKNLGKIITLQNKLIEVHLQFNQGKKATDLQEKIINSTQRKESAYFKLANMYLELGKREEAKKANQKAKIHLDKLPVRIRKNSAMKNLDLKIKELTTKLN